jgi:hypothetical protein
VDNNPSLVGGFSFFDSSSVFSGWSECLRRPLGLGGVVDNNPSSMGGFSFFFKDSSSVFSGWSEGGNIVKAE